MSEKRTPLEARKHDWRWPWVRGYEYISQEGTSFWRRLREAHGLSREDVYELSEYSLTPARQADIEGDYAAGAVWEMDDLLTLATIYGRAPGELLDASLDEKGSELLAGDMQDLAPLPPLDEVPPLVSVYYRNYRGESASRRVTPLRVRFGTTEHHKEPQFLLEVFDHDKRAARTFALAECDFDSERW
jgi:hypothetical protein